MDTACEDKKTITEAEAKVLRLMQRGMTNREIALALNRSEHTIKTQVHFLLTKFEVRNRTQLCLIFSKLSLDDRKYIV